MTLRMTMAIGNKVLNCQIIVVSNSRVSASFWLFAAQIAARRLADVSYSRAFIKVKRLMHNDTQRPSGPSWVPKRRRQDGAFQARNAPYAAERIAKEGLQSIENLKVGDLVLSKDEVAGTVSWKPVSALIRRHQREIWEVSFEVASDERNHRNSSEVFGTTDDHPWRTAAGTWAWTDELRAGVRIQRADGTSAIVRAVTKTNRVENTFNLEVADFHTYFVGEAAVWVHNACGDTLRPGPSAGRSIPAGRGRASASQQRQVNEIGAETGCHTCGTRNPGTQSGNFIADQQPPTALAKPEDSEVFVPHCDSCSRTQAGKVTAEVRRRRAGQ